MASPPAATGAGAVSMGERAYAELRDRIISLQLPPGSPLVEDQLMEELAVGRTPVREAIKRLALESLVEVYSRRGTFVSEIQITDLAAISEVREQLEGYAAALAAERFRPEVDGSELQRLLDELESVDERPAEGSMSLDAEIHRFIYGVVRNPFLEDTLTRYFNLSFRIWNLALSRLPAVSSSVGEHRELLLAVREGDAPKSRKIASRHVAQFEREMRAVL